jgi:hypothetical protein
MQSRINGVALTAGATYYFVVDGYGSASGNYSFQILLPCVDTACPTGFGVGAEIESNCGTTNNTCATAEMVVENLPYCATTFRTSSTAFDTDYFKVITGVVRDISITVAANCVPLSVTLYSGACPGTSMTTISVPAQTVVTSSVFLSQPAGAYTIKVTPTTVTNAPCTANNHYGFMFNVVAPPPPPANDLPENATPIALGDCVTGSTLYATDNTGAYADLTHLSCPWIGYYSATSSGLSKDVFYSVTLPCDAQYTFDLTGSSYDTALGVWNSLGQLVAGNDDAVGLQSKIFCCELSAGTYLISVDGYGASAGNYNFCLSQCTDCPPPVDANDVPTGFDLKQNVPNPFNPTTSIAYSMPETGVASLKVYDVAGHVVATLVDGMVTRGEHTVVFDAGSLTSGVYFYTLQAGASSETRKMVLMK